MQVTFPYQAMKQTMTPRFVGASIEPQRAISGAETVIPTLGGRWEVSCTFVVHREAQFLAWQAFLAQMEGRIGTTLVPIITRFRPKDRDGHGITGCDTAGFSDAQTWEHFGFVNEPTATMTLVDPAPLRATVIRVVPGNTTGIRPGQFFSIGERLYRVQRHWQTEDGVTNLMIQPPLRQSFERATLILDRPVCKMRFASEEDGDLEQLMSRLSEVTCNFVEAI